MRAVRIIEVGERFGRLTATKTRSNAKELVTALCDCGNAHQVRIENWGKTASCGCLQREATAAATTRHGMSQSPEYTTWVSMWTRCTNPRSKYFKDYGGRGITVCDEWKDFAVFLADMGPRPSARHSIDRTDNDGSYTPNNCRWATPREQALNQRPRRRSTHCDNGHEFTPETTAVSAQGHRRCRICLRAGYRRARDAKRSKALGASK